MKITEVRIFPTESRDGKLKAFATMTFDDWFVVRNVKVIQGNNGLFVAMPSKKAMDSCPKCNFKNVIGSKYCNQCGSRLEQKQVLEENARESQGNHMDIAHPITQECRVYIQEKILEVYSKGAVQAPGAGSEKAAGQKQTADEQQVSDRSATGEENKREQKEETIELESSKDIEL